MITNFKLYEGISTFINYYNTNNLIEFEKQILEEPEIILYEWNSKTLMNHIINDAKYEILNILLKHNKISDNMILEVIYEDAKYILQKLIKYGRIDIDYIIGGKSLLQHDIHIFEIFRYLIENGANLYHEDDDGDDIMDYKLWKGKTSIDAVIRLLYVGYDVERFCKIFVEARPSLTISNIENEIKEKLPRVYTVLTKYKKVSDFNL